MQKILFLLLLSVQVYGMQTTITVNDTTHELGLAKPLPQRTNSPTDLIGDKIPPRVSPKPLTSPNIKVFDGMTVDEVKTWIVGTIAQYEEKHAITLQELSDALDKHATAVATAKDTADGAQSSSKYAVYVAIISGTCSVLVCVASSLLAHYL